MILIYFTKFAPLNQPTMMKELLEKVKDDAANEIYSLPYAFLNDNQKATISDLISMNFANEFYQATTSYSVKLNT